MEVLAGPARQPFNQEMKMQNHLIVLVLIAVIVTIEVKIIIRKR